VFHRLAVFVLACLPLVATAEVYQYKDANGNTVFSDSPPPGAKAIRKDIRTPPPPADSSGALNEKMQEFQKRREEAGEKEAKQAKEKAEQEKAAENCSRARSKVAALETGQRIVRFNAQGEREFLDDAGREKELAEARQSASEWCK
jgi:hypothetical protein